MTTRVIIELPEDVYRRLEAVARQSRQAVPDVVSDVVVRSVRSFPVNDRREEMMREAVAFRRMHPVLQRDYAGQYVAIAGGEMVDHDLDPVALLRRVRQAHPGRTVLQRKVAEGPERVLHFRSPRLTP